MALFRRRSTSEDLPDENSTEQAEALADLTGADTDLEAAVGRSDGPFDDSEADLADGSLPRLDLGSLLIPGLPGVQVQVEADPSTQEVRAVTGVVDDGAVQLQPFAAPRSEGIWDEIRAEMLAEISATAGATVTEGEGAFGPELRAVVPARTPEGKQVLQPLRFTGIDGPRWFLRAVFLGRAAVEPDPDDVLHTLVRQTIVVRGAEAMAPRDPLPLHLPEQAPADAQGPDGAAEPDLEDVEADAADDVPGKYADLDPFERGPEITEIR
jgi:hypothetical protein